MKLPKDEVDIQSGYIEENSFNQNSNNNNEQIIADVHDADFDY
jgi:hypothetical protein